MKKQTVNFVRRLPTLNKEPYVIAIGDIHRKMGETIGVISKITHVISVDGYIIIAGEMKENDPSLQR